MSLGGHNVCKCGVEKGGFTCDPVGLGLFLDSDDTIDRDKECSHRRTGATHSGIC
jgi:hypothetical protein